MEGRATVAGRSGPGLTAAQFHILLALTDGELHGYEIMRVSARDSQGAMKLGPTTLYRSLRGLLERGLIEESDRRPDPEQDDERRHYYRLTPSGWAAARRETERLRALVRIAERKALAAPPRQRPAGQP